MIKDKKKKKTRHTLHSGYFSLLRQDFGGMCMYLKKKKIISLIKLFRVKLQTNIK